MCNWSDIVYYIGYNGLNMEEKAATYVSFFAVFACVGLQSNGF